MREGDGVEALLSLKEWLEDLYEKYDTYLLSVGKLLLAFLAFWQINGQMGYMGRLDSVFLVLILALFCSFLPWNAIVLISGGMILAHLYALSLPALVVGGAMTGIVLLLYFGIAPRQGLALVLTGVSLSFGVPCLVPMAFGLVGTPLSGVGIAAGTVLYYGLRAVCTADASALAGAEGRTAAQETEDLLGQMERMVQAIGQERELILMLIAMIAVLVLVYVIRKMAMKYAWSIGIAAGAGAFLIVTVLGGWTLGLTELILRAIVGTVISVAVASLLELLFFHLDYRHTKKVQFEDDEYYYYVKAVPKRRKGRENHGEY